jgi:hypothetical protein
MRNSHSHSWARWLKQESEGKPQRRKCGCRPHLGLDALPPQRCQRLHHAVAHCGVDEQRLQKQARGEGKKMRGGQAMSVSSKRFKSRGIVVGPPSVVADEASAFFQQCQAGTSGWPACLGGGDLHSVERQLRLQGGVAQAAGRQAGRGSGGCQKDSRPGLFQQLNSIKSNI